MDILLKGLTRKYVVVGSQKDLCILKPFFEKNIRNIFFIFSNIFRLFTRPKHFFLLSHT